MALVIDPRFEQVRQNFQSRYLPAKNTGKATIIAVASNEAGDIGALNNGSKLIKSVLNVLALFSSFEPIKNGAKFFGGISDAIKVLGLGKAPQELKANEGKTLKIASISLGIIGAGGALLKIFDSIKLIELAQFSKTLGQLSPALGKWLPISNIFNVVDIAKASLDIIDSAGKIKKTNQLKKDTNPDGKLKYWQETDVCTSTFRTAHIDSQKEKLLLVEIELDAINQDYLPNGVELLEKAEKEVRNAESELSKASLFGQIKARLNLHKAQKAEKRILALIEKLEIDSKLLIEKHERYTARKDAWTNADIESNQSQLKEKKIAKWKVKATNIQKEMVKEGLMIALNTVLIVALVATTVFTGMALLGSVAFSLPVSLLFLSISFIGEGIHLYKKYRPTEKYEHVDLSKLATA